MAINAMVTSTCADAADLMEGHNFVDKLERNVNICHICTEKLINSHKVLELVRNEFLLEQGGVLSKRKK